MSGNTYQTNPLDSVTDAKLTEDTTTDSGFLSGGNLQLSSDNLSEDFAEESKGSHLEGPMKLDSGFELSESFSELNIKNSGLNDLSRSKSTQEPPVVSAEPCNDTWMDYFQQDEDGDTFLHMAIYEGDIAKVLALIRKAPFPLLLDTPNDDAYAPIHIAVSLGNAKIVRWLIVAGAKPSPRNIRGDSPLHIAARNGDLSCCQAITTPIQPYERLSLGLQYDHQIYQQANLDQWNYQGQTCVHVAAQGGHVDVLRHLVWYGADINAREGCSGFAALHYAIQKGDERLGNFLLKECKKLKADIVTYGGNSALQLGYPVPNTIAEVLRSRGVPSYNRNYDDSDDDSDSDLYENSTPIFVRNLVDASA